MIGQPSVLVLFLGGWGAYSREKGNLFVQKQCTFLDELVSAYPTTTISDVRSLIEYYTLLGRGFSQLDADSGIRRFVISGPDRYGLIMQHLFPSGKPSQHGDHVDYRPFPPSENLLEIIPSFVDDIFSATHDAMRYSEGALILAAIDMLWSAGRYGNISAMSELVIQVHEQVLGIVNKAMTSEMTVLIASDGGWLEEYIDIDSSKVSYKRTSNPTPVILIRPELEGVRSTNIDATSGQVIAAKPSGTVEDLSYTILKLLGVAYSMPAHNQYLFGTILNDIRV